jgi:Protein of unknown function (DUF2384)
MQRTVQPKDLFKAIFGLPRDKVRQLVHTPQDKPKIASQKVLQGLENYLNISPGEATHLVGWNPSRKSRNTTLDRDALDRAYAALEVYERVQNYLGDNASAWLRERSPHLEGRRPIDLLETRAGYRELSDLLDAIESGNYL